MIFQHFVYWAFLAIISGGVIVSARVLFNLAKSVSSLNLKIAVILEKVSYHEKAIDRHGDRIKELENGRAK